MHLHPRREREAVSFAGHVERGVALAAAETHSA
jgi:hypothetical protein